MRNLRAYSKSRLFVVALAVLALGALGALTLSGRAQERDRSKIADKYKWNLSEKYADVSTLAHELGHTMQSYYSNKTEPYPLANYPTFVAEVASTFNETLLIQYMLANDNIIRDDDTRLALLGNHLENIKGTVFRQAQFAEFELRMHEMEALLPKRAH